MSETREFIAVELRNLYLTVRCEQDWVAYADAVNQRICTVAKAAAEEALEKAAKYFQEGYFTNDRLNNLQVAAALRSLKGAKR